MQPPIYVLYKIDSFYQNHRRYIQSKSNPQLLGKSVSRSEVEICSPFITNSDMQVTTSWTGVPLDPNAIASPCGAIARTFFNDTFTLSKNGNNITIVQSGITWPGDQGGKYKRSDNSQATQWVDPENEHFIVWMRTAGLPNFKKLWGKIEVTLSPGMYSMSIVNNYKVRGW
jgi:hypothetical protein